MRVATVSRKRRSWRDAHDGAVEVLQQLLEPCDGGEVEVVGRLVQQQHVGQRRPAPAPAPRAFASLRTSRPPRRSGGSSSFDSTVSTRCDSVQPPLSSSRLCSAVDAGQARGAVAVRQQRQSRGGSRSAAGLRPPGRAPRCRRPRDPRRTPAPARRRRCACRARSRRRRHPGPPDPARTRSSDDLPVPLRPMSPMRSRASSWKSASSSSGWWPNARRARDSVISGMRGPVAAPAAVGTCGGDPLTRERERASRCRIGRAACARRACRARN